ncbi:MAG: PilT/PilU family type 4a pilus ATPase [Erysipelotrichaceae bacterium]|nr:PilT/PilU family type 4a pilus ATPase [Erysipelotrichaceae bacterium]
MIEEILREAVEQHASDVFIIAGKPVCLKVHGVIKSRDENRLSAVDTRTLIEEIYDHATNRSFDRLHEQYEDDFSFALPKVGRFRVNAFYQRGSLSAVLRVVKFDLPDPKEYHIPDGVMDLAKLQKGLVIVTGSAGSGKTTTLACIIDAINKTRNAHIITIEDPIEYLHHHEQSIVTQREIASDTRDYVSAIRSALREAPDVILVGEMRDLETISIALTAAETGHLVLSTLHTMSAADTVNRIIDIFPPTQQAQIRVQLAMSLKAVVAQQLIPSTDVGVVPAFEMMHTNNAIRTMIRDSKTHQIDNAIAGGRASGMMSMDDSILQLYKDGLITAENAISYATNPDLMSRNIGK